MSAIDTKSLRELAQGATKGPWVSHEENGFPYVLGPDDELLGGPVTIADGSEHLSIADAAYIAAASPDVILGLLDEVERLRAERDRQRQPHPMAPDRCPVCAWTNVGLMNYGTTDASKWMCHGCAAHQLAKMDAALVRIAELESSAIRMREYRFALEGIETDGSGNPIGAAK
jgi:hypothetical protein